MPLSTQEKTDLMFKHGRNAGDTGSPEVQIALLSARITELRTHIV
ncbi:MAG: 30S ribosomal protein S15, partial [Gammaproteobacteria bacterium]|nr:30S ribosomal protein S15 [Gammaproteobacteria bacterium]